MCWICVKHGRNEGRYPRSMFEKSFSHEAEVVFSSVHIRACSCSDNCMRTVCCPTIKKMLMLQRLRRGMRGPSPRSRPYTKRHCYVSLPTTNLTLLAGCYAAAGGAVGRDGICSICRIRKLFSSMNCSSSVRSSRKVGKKRNSFSRLLIKIFCTARDLCGFATKTCRR
jgi:hypothetical protein